MFGSAVNRVMQARVSVARPRPSSGPPSPARDIGNSTHAQDIGNSTQSQDIGNSTHSQGTRNSTQSRKRSSVFGRVSQFVFGNHPLVATLVEDVPEGEVVEAERVLFVERNWKVWVSAAVVFSLSILAIAIGVVFFLRNKDEAEGGALTATAGPTLSPTFDPRPTLKIIQERGHLLCGFGSEVAAAGEGFFTDLCRSIAAVVLGDPDSYVPVPVTSADRWRQLHHRKVDVLVFGNTHTIEREVRESSTGSGFTFTTPFKYDGMIFVGNRTLVRCAEDFKHFGECASLKIGVGVGTTHHAFLKQVFPTDLFVFSMTFQERTEMLLNGTCNVIAAEGTAIRNSAPMGEAIRDGIIVLGERLMTNEPLALVTRNTDREFSDVANWVVHALLFGEVWRLSKDASLCRSYTESTLRDASELDYLNAVHCVGNYAEIFDGDPVDRRINGINNGTGMLYVIPFGNIENDDYVEPATESITLANIRKEGSFTCGVVVPDDSERNVTRSDKLVGMSIDYCRALSAAIFFRDPERVNFLTFAQTNNNSVIALANGTLDVLVGGRNEREFDFATSRWPGGLHFSTPYFYGNESPSNDVSFYSMVTREDDTMFASFVNCIVLATIYAQENDIKRENWRELPLVSAFGSDSSFVLKDAISYSGSYDEIYGKHFGSEVAGRGRNSLNNGGPIMLSFLHKQDQGFH